MQQEIIKGTFFLNQHLADFLAESDEYGEAVRIAYNRTTSLQQEHGASGVPSFVIETNDPDYIVVMLLLPMGSKEPVLRLEKTMTMI